jgi:chromosome segregation protein
VRLKKLVIVGFKSFADKTTLYFDTGITCIVGPNGCGKSNIADAFRWVLGEQSAKSMRGNKMPDVIFAGTSQRKPLNFAEVSLTLTDIQGKLPIDYEEVTITRRLHRSGESDYLLNGHPVRLKDLQSLFLDSGIGRNAFAIFEQGKIDQVINYTPLERRYIFEEAAGILRFLQRKREALKKLEQADLNLSRVKDIHQEVERQINVLQKQAEKARIFKENKALLEGLEKGLCLAKWELLEKKKEEFKKRQDSVKEQLNEAAQQLHEKQMKWQEDKQALADVEKKWRKKEEELFMIRGERELHIREHQNSQQNIKEAQIKERKIKQELEELKLRQQLRQKTRNELLKKRQEIEQALKEAEKKVSSQRDRTQAKEKEVQQIQAELQLKQQARLKLMQTANQNESEWKQNQVRLENNLDRQKRLEERLFKLQQEALHSHSLLQEKKEQLSHLSSIIDAHKDRLEGYEEELKSLSCTVEQKQKELDSVRRKNVEQTARQKVLLRLREEKEGFSAASKKMLEEAQNPKSPLYQKIKPLYEFLKPQSPQMIEVFSALLRHYAQTLVVNTLSDFQLVLAWSEEHQLSDFSLICEEMIEEKTAPASFATDVVPHKLAHHFLYQMHRAVDLSQALKEISHLKGDVWLSKGTFFDKNLVFFNVKPNENQVFTREAELNALEEELLTLEDKLKGCEKELQQLQQRRQYVQLERAEIDKMLRRDEMKLVEVNFGLQKAIADQEKNKNETEQLEKDLSALRDQVEQQSLVLKNLEKQSLEAKNALAALQQQIEKEEQEIEKELNAMRLHAQDSKEQEAAHQHLIDENRKMLHELNVLEIKDQEGTKQEERLSEELDYLADLQAKAKDKTVSFHQFLESVESKLEEAVKVSSTLEKEVLQCKERLEKKEQEGLELQTQMKKMEQDGHQLALQMAQNQSAALALENELQERYGLSLEQTKQGVAPLTKSLEQTEKQIRSLRQSLQEAGDVNLASIEELERHQVRYSFLNQQMNDMTVSKQELIEIIAQLDTESRKIFKETFDQIRHNFQKNFQILFNGGEADLQFTETDNVLEAGIEIIAKPPGKQMRSISLLSGGEKCLTAVALLFAIFEVKSSPFCILDEIDAPLDDTNVERFVNVVKHFVDRCQFLIITHNKRTMAIGDVLFGVSMEEKGVSKLLSLEFSRQEAPQASLV